MTCGARSKHLLAVKLYIPTLLLLLAASCGGGTGTTRVGNTAVTVLASSTANDQTSGY